MKNEIWKPVSGYEGIYEISSLGRVKSLKRTAIVKGGYSRTVNERIMVQANDTKYNFVGLRKNKSVKHIKIHKLVAIAFLGHKSDGHKLVVNHKDFNKLNNHIENLEIVTHRENTNRKHLKSSSQYVGVYWSEKRKRWISCIRIKNKGIYLGSFKNEIDAHLTYEKYLKEMKL